MNTRQLPDICPPPPHPLGRTSIARPECLAVPFPLRRATPSFIDFLIEYVLQIEIKRSLVHDDGPRP